MPLGKGPAVPLFLAPKRFQGRARNCDVLSEFDEVKQNNFRAATSSALYGQSWHSICDPVCSLVPLRVPLQGAAARRDCQSAVCAVRAVCALELGCWCRCRLLLHCAASGCCCFRVLPRILFCSWRKFGLEKQLANWDSDSTFAPR